MLPIDVYLLVVCMYDIWTKDSPGALRQHPYRESAFLRPWDTRWTQGNRTRGVSVALLAVAHSIGQSSPSEHLKWGSAVLRRAGSVTKKWSGIWIEKHFFRSLMAKAVSGAVQSEAPLRRMSKGPHSRGNHSALWTKKQTGIAKGSGL